MRKISISILVIIAMIFMMTTFMSFASEETTSSITLKYSSESIGIGGTLKNKLQGATGKVKWSSSNKKIATVSKKGVIKGKNPGHCIITAKSRGTSYKCAIQVVRQKPDFDARIVAVKKIKQKPCVVVRFENNTGKTLTILKKAHYIDLTGIDYKLKLKKKQIKIGSHKAKSVTFYNYGNKELYNFAGRQDPDIFAEALESDLYYQIKFDGKKYEGHTYWYYVEDEETGHWTDYYKSVFQNGDPTVSGSH